MGQVLIWDVEAQPNRHAVLGATNSRPDLVCPVQRKFVFCFFLINFFLFFFFSKINFILMLCHALDIAMMTGF